MPPLAPSQHEKGPRVIVYHQTHYHEGKYVSILPLLTEKSGVTHVMIAAIHLNDPPGNITLNNDAYDHAAHAVLWQEVQTVRRAGVKVLGMLGGAAKGSFRRLDQAATPAFEAHYEPLRRMVEFAGLDGLDLDVEEDMSLPGIVRLIDRLKADFGPGFLITLAPVAPALAGQPHLSGFSYFDLEKAVGRHVAWYNAQFYCGWGSAETTEHYDALVACGWPPRKLVLGLVTNPANGAGWVFEDLLTATLAVLRDRYPDFGGVMGWEYFNSLFDSSTTTTTSSSSSSSSGPHGKPWLWARGMSTLLRSEVKPSSTPPDPAHTDNSFLQIVQKPT